jgi:superfamily II DNA or RNA helicase
MFAINNDNLTVTFNRWDMSHYDVFIKSKSLPEFSVDYDWESDSYKINTHARFAHIFNLDENHVAHDWLPFNQGLFDYQRYIVETAIKNKRFAVWADTGLGKTIIYLEWARQVMHLSSGKVLLIVPLNILQQTIEEAVKFYGAEYQIKRLNSKTELLSWCRNDGGIAIVNPEKFIPDQSNTEYSDMRYCNGVVLDEASLLKNHGGKIATCLIDSCRGIEYKISCTATPAPNDTIEYAAHGAFLEKVRNEGELLWTFFSRSKDGGRKVKEHAKDAFYRFMSGWSIYLRNPVRYGFDDNLKDLPAPTIKEYRLSITDEQRKIMLTVPDNDGQISMFSNRSKLGIVDRTKFGQIARGFIYVGADRKVVRVNSVKPGYVADLVRNDAADGLQVMVWTVFDEESQILSEMLGDISHDVLTGKLSQEKRIAIIEAFRTGKSKVLISKPSLLGFGLNFQNCGSMVFSGIDDSFERFYQSVRRAYRYGQTKSVRVHIPYIPELEGTVWNNIQDKQWKFERDTEIMERNYLNAINGGER